MLAFYSEVSLPELTSSGDTWPGQNCKFVGPLIHIVIIAMITLKLLVKPNFDSKDMVSFNDLSVEVALGVSKGEV